jgi:hypothetical protein
MDNLFLSLRLGRRLVGENPIDVFERIRRLLDVQNPRDLLRVELSDLLQVKDKFGLVLVVARNVKDAIFLDNRNPPEAL